MFIISGLATSLPPHRVDQSQAADWARQLCCDTDSQSRMLGSLYRRSHIAQRHTAVQVGEYDAANDPANTVATATITDSYYPQRTDPQDQGPTTAKRMSDYTQAAYDLSSQAVTQALANADVQPSQIKHLVTVSCTGFEAPGFDIALIKQLGLPMSTSRSHVGFMGCHGALNGLRVASALATANPGEHVLLCAVELCSLHFGYGWNPQQIVANSLFADGAAAMVGVHHPDHHDKPAIKHLASGSTLLSDSEELMRWVITDHGFSMTLSPQVPVLVEKHLRPWLLQWLNKHDVSLDEISCWAVHPGGPRILDAVQACLDLDDSHMAASRTILETCGNMSSPTTFFIVDALRRQGTKGRCVAMGFGPGLTIEAALLDLC